MKFWSIILGLVLTALLIPTEWASCQWMDANGIGAEVRALAFLGDSTILAGTNTGLIETTDEGATWKNISPAGLTARAYAVAVRGNTIVLATPNEGVYISQDKGTTWSDISRLSWKTSSGQAVLSVLFHDSSLFVGTNQSFFKSTDFGSTWGDLAGAIPPYTPVNCLSSYEGSIFFGSSGAVFESKDDGATWEQRSTGLPNTWVSCLAFLGDDEYAGTYSGIFKSVDHGMNWNRVGKTISDTVISSLAAIGTDLYVGTLHGLYVSRDSGATWASTSAGFQALPTYAIGGHNGILVAGAGGVLVSHDDGNTWSLECTTVGSPSALASDADRLYAANDGNVHYTSDSAKIWKVGPKGFPLTTLTTLSLAVRPHVILHATSAGVLASSDRGLSWHDANAGLVSHVAIALGGDSSHAIVATNDGIFYSTNDGEQWKQAYTGFPAPRVSAFLTYGARIIATTDVGLFISTDHGEQWATSNHGVESLGLYCATRLQDDLFIGTSHGVYRSSDSGGHWAQLSFDLSTLAVTGLTSYGEILFATTGYLSYHDGQVFASYDRGIHWRNISDNISGDGSFLAIHPFGGSLFVSTERGLFKRSLEELGASAPNEQTIAGLSIACYPNPTANVATIRLSSIESGIADVTLTNVLGGTVSTIFHGRLESGVHEFAIRSHGLASGSYICTARIAGQSKSIMLFLGD